MDKEGVGIIVVLISFLWFIMFCFGFCSLLEFGSPLQAITETIGLTITVLGIYIGYKLM